MTTDTDLQRQVTSVFADAAPSGYPDELLARVLSTTSRTRSRPAWLANIKEPPMRIPSRVVVGSPTLRLAAILALTLALILAAAGVVVAGASLLPGPTLPPPYGLARNGSLVYEKGGDIWLADADGANPRDIVPGDTPAFAPWFSHDGAHIAYGTGPDDAVVLMVANADGTNAQQLPTLFEWWDFMPTDDAVVGTRIADDHLLLSTHELGSGVVRNVPLGGIEPGGWVEARPRDGAELIFTGHPTPGSPDLGLFAIKPDGSGLRPVGAVSTDESPAGDQHPWRISFQNPTLSPDGRTVAYWNWEPNPSRSGARLHMRDLDSGEELPILFDLSDNGLIPHFSPDGHNILFEHSGGGDQVGLVYASVDGSRPSVPVGPTFASGDRLDHGFSPDGTKAFLSLAGVTDIVDLATNETTAVHEIPNIPSWQRLAPLVGP